MLILCERNTTSWLTEELEPHWCLCSLGVLDANSLYGARAPLPVAERVRVWGEGAARKGGRWAEWPTAAGVVAGGGGL